VKLEPQSIPESVEEFATLLERYRTRRRRKKERQKRNPIPRRALSAKERELVLAKTGGRCHICGGSIEESWQADHVLAHSVGGVQSAENYLPAHTLCNNYRWDYSSKEFQEILKLGVWVRTQIIRRTPIVEAVAKRYLEYERARLKRRKSR